MTEAEGEHGLAETAARSGQEEQPKVFVLAMFENSSSFERKIMDGCMDLSAAICLQRWGHCCFHSLRYFCRWPQRQMVVSTLTLEFDCSWFMAGWVWVWKLLHQTVVSLSHRWKCPRTSPPNAGASVLSPSVERLRAEHWVWCPKSAWTGLIGLMKRTNVSINQFDL